MGPSVSPAARRVCWSCRPCSLFSASAPEPPLRCSIYKRRVHLQLYFLSEYFALSEKNMSGFSRTRANISDIPCVIIPGRDFRVHFLSNQSWIPPNKECSILLLQEQFLFLKLRLLLLQQSIQNCVCLGNGEFSAKKFIQETDLSRPNSSLTSLEKTRTATWV